MMGTRRQLSERRKAALERMPEAERAANYRALWKLGYDIPGPQSREEKTRDNDGWTEEKAIEQTPCIHRGEPIGEHVCKPCQGKRRHTIFVCSLHGACTVRAASGATWDGKKTRCCLTCNDCSVLPQLPALDLLSVDEERKSRPEGLGVRVVEEAIDRVDRQIAGNAQENEKDQFADRGALLQLNGTAGEAIQEAEQFPHATTLHG